MNAVKIIATIVYIVFIGVTLLMVGNINQYFDMPALVVVVVIAILYALAAKGDKTYVQKFGDGAVRAGWLGSIIGIIIGFWCVYYFDIENGIEKAFDTIDYSLTKIEDEFKQDSTVSK